MLSIRTRCIGYCLGFHRMSMPLGLLERISQVLSNLLSNAVKFTEVEDNIVISAEKKEVDEVVIISQKYHHHLRVQPYFSNL